jgi:membrane associated rhomboid family serine protease
MGSRVYPLSLVVGALLADGVGIHRVAYYLLLLAVVGAAAAAFLGVADVLEGKKSALLRGVTTSLALVFLVVGAAVRANMPDGASVPKVAISAAVAALLVYGLPLVAWVVEPLRPRPRRSSRPVRVSTSSLVSRTR